MTSNNITNEIHYHICVYPEWELKIDKKDNTSSINRTFENCSDDKKKMEQLFEKYRLENTPELSSRKSCFYVCQQENINLWIKRLTKEKTGFKVFKVRLDGELFWTECKFY